MQQADSCRKQPKETSVFATLRRHRSCKLCVQESRVGEYLEYSLRQGARSGLVALRNSESGCKAPAGYRWRP